jgi:hypothetical protein
MCIAAYLAIGGGLGVSLSTAAHLRTALVWLCWCMLALLIARMIMRFRARAVVVARQALRSATEYASVSSAVRRSLASRLRIPLRGVVGGYIKQGHG